MIAHLALTCSWTPREKQIPSIPKTGKNILAVLKYLRPMLEILALGANVQIQVMPRSQFSVIQALQRSDFDKHRNMDIKISLNDSTFGINL
jgi:hypothetical protein